MKCKLFTMKNGDVNILEDRINSFFNEKTVEIVHVTQSTGAAASSLGVIDFTTITVFYKEEK